MTSHFRARPNLTMGRLPLRVLLPMTVLVLVVAAAAAQDDEYTWPQWKVPLVRKRRTVPLSSPHFSARPQPQRSGMCGIECQRRLPAASLDDLEHFLSYETVYENGSRTYTSVAVEGLNEVTAWPRNVSSRSRQKREVYGTDTRFTISDKQFSTKYPFSTSVKISTGCSGVLVSPKHVLTAAHCIHDGKDYLDGAQKLRVGILKEKSRRGKGERRGGRGKGRRRKEDKEQEEVADKEENGGKGERRGRGKGRRNRSRRSVESEKPSFRWTRVKKTQVPKGWFKGVSGGLNADYDYAVLELKKAPKVKHMDLGVIPSLKKIPAGRIHFSGFDDDRPGNLVYRFCSVSEESNDLVYQYCDAKPGSSGSGVYIRLKEPGKKKWKRKIIGVFTGHQWVDVNGDGTQQDYNVAVRITPLKYAQICYWVNGDTSQCKVA